jgi:hypothetical protein
LTTARQRLSGWTGRHEHVAAAVVLVGVLCVWCWPVLLGRELGQNYLLFDFVPWQSAKPADLHATPHSGEGDVAYIFQPLLHVARDQLHAGHLPIWNPYSYAGNVLLGDMQTALLSPLTWIALILPVGAAWGLIAILKLLIAGVGTCAFSRQVGVGRTGALLAAVVFMFCAPVTVWLQHPMGTVFALFGWLMLVTDRLYRRPDATGAALVAAVVALVVFCGHPESAFLGSLCAGVYLIGLAVFSSARRTGSAVRALAWWLAGHAVGVLVAAVVVLPFLEAYRDSASRTSHALQAGHALPLHSILVYVMPTVYGTGQPRAYGWGAFTSYNAMAAYFGLVCLMLAAGAAWVAYRRAEVRALALVALVVVGIAYHAPPLGWAAQHIWPLDSVITARLYVYVAFVGAVGAGAAVSLLSRRRLRPRVIVACGAGLLVAVLALYVAEVSAGTLSAPADVRSEAVLRFLVFLAIGTACLAALGRVRDRIVVPVVIAACVLDLLFLQGYNVWLPRRQADPGTPPVAVFLQHRPRPFRVSTLEQPPTDVYPPNTSARDRLESVEGYDFPQSQRWAIFSASVLGQSGPTLERLVGTPVPHGKSLTGLRMVNVRYYVTPPAAPAPNPAFRAVYRGPDARVYEDPGALPRAYVVSRAVPVEDSRALELMSAGRWDPRRIALVPPGTAPITSVPQSPRAARVRELAADHLRVDVPAGPAGWLVLANSYSPQWRATVDGRDVRPRPTNYAALGVPVPAGRHVVEFRVSHRSFWLGAAISLLTSGAVIAVLVVSRRRRRTFRPVHG